MQAGCVEEMTNKSTHNLDLTLFSVWQGVWKSDSEIRSNCHPVKMHKKIRMQLWSPAFWSLCTISAWLYHTMLLLNNSKICRPGLKPVFLKSISPLPSSAMGRHNEQGMEFKKIFMIGEKQQGVEEAVAYLGWGEWDTSCRSQLSGVSLPFPFTHAPPLPTPLVHSGQHTTAPPLLSRAWVCSVSSRCLWKTW